MLLKDRRAVLLAALGAVLLFPSTTHAQAWVPPGGEGSVSILYHHLFVQDHVFARGERHDVGHIRTHLLTADVEYGVTDRLTLRALLPFVTTKYSGVNAHAHPGEAPSGFHKLDDGSTHAAFQDLRVEARYGAREFPVAIAPFVALTVPTHDYEVFAHSAIGLNMMELQIGTYGGVLRGPFAIQGRLSYGFYQPVIGRRRNRSNVDAEIAWLAGRKVRLSLFQATQVSHGGVDLPLDAVLDRSIARNEWWPHHDQLARANWLNLGGGASIRLTPSFAVHGSVLRTMAGRNTHATDYGMTAGATWGFGGARPLHASPHRP